MARVVFRPLKWSHGVTLRRTSQIEKATLRWILDPGVNHISLLHTFLLARCTSQKLHNLCLSSLFHWSSYSLNMLP